MNYSSDSLIATIRLRAGLPQDALVTDAQILEAMNYELSQTILPMVIEAGAEYYVTWEDFPIQRPGVYEIPALASGKKLRDVHIVNNNNDENQREVIGVLPQLALPNLAQNYQANYQKWYDQIGFVVIGNKLRTYPLDTYNQGNLRLYYYRRPNQCVLVSEGANITVLSATQFSVPAVPAGWPSTVQIDLIQKTPSFDCIYENVTATYSGTTFTVPTTELLSNGDHVNLTGETSYPQMPVDLQNMLIQSVCMRMYEIIRDDARLALASAMYDKMKANTMKLISPRVDGRVVKITSLNSIKSYLP